ncbi:TonB-dependent receptor domain-containing protein [Sphingomonas montanisoli]|uniref:TonB-dependent receptor plug domain-containing protein n=1 Tax=Sphingomonas montanisoli TaxID=2606412 RepID=A0A5D9CEL0_9SPHN|nr:TonB-dependent receptor [Sphingomonas montanisoli]TZG29420.1 TonB-dependent receptor plug domain-containing protein [Sphingomonas montanisoli]
MRQVGAILSGVALVVAAPASAERFDLPAGTLRDAVGAMARQASVNVAVDDQALWLRAVPAVRGDMNAGSALRRMLAGTGAKVRRIDARSWRVSLPPKAVRRPTTIRIVELAPRRDDIVVTASKRDTRLRDFAGSVGMLSGRDLMFGGEQGMESILARMASLSSTHLGAGRNKLFIRGIADSSFTGPTQATVGQYLGDLRLTYNAPDPDLRLYDIRSVEVLEGPQGTLYGAGSLGGIIRIVPNTPDLDRPSGSVSGGLSVIAHGDPGGDVGGTINLPVSEKLGLRVTGYGVREGGYIDDVWRDRKDVNRTSIGGGRATLRVAPGDGWTIDLGGVFQDTDGRDSQYADRGQPPLTRASRTDGGFDADYVLGQLVVGKAWDGLSFLSSTGYVRQRLAERYDATATGGPDRIFLQSNRTRMFASENRLWRPMAEGFGWVAGVSYTRNRTYLARALGPVGTPPPSTGVVNRISELTGYGELSAQPLDGLTLTAGARYTHARLSGDGADVAPVFAPVITRLGLEAKRRDNRFLPSASVSGAVMPGLLLFARYQQGFRPGGLAIEGPIVRRFESDRVRTMEAGLRYGEHGRDPFDLSLSIAHTRWSDIQADYVDSSGLPSTANIGDGRIWSLSAAMGWKPVPRLLIEASAAYNNSRVTNPSPSFTLSILNSFTFAALGSISSGVVDNAVAVRAAAGMKQIPNVARVSGRIGVDYSMPVGDTMDLRVGGWLRYVGKSRLGIGPVLGEEQGDYLDSALTARLGTAEWGVTLGLTNLTDEIGNRFALGTPFAAGGGRQITPLRPRTIRLGLDRSF